MNALVFWLLVLIPGLLGYAVGLRVPLGKTMSSFLRIASASISGVGTAYLTFRAHFTWPIGLLSPLLFGLIAAVLISLTLKHFASKYPSVSHTLGARRCRWDGFAGAAIGLMLVLVMLQWNALTQVDSTPQTTSELTMVKTQASRRTALDEFARLAHEGFVQHVPMAGTVTDELLAIASILEQPFETRRQYAVARQWDSLAELPSFAAIVENDELVADLDAAAQGGLLALYRLQKHPLVLEFAREPELQILIAKFDAKQIAKELQAFADQAD